MSEIEPPGNVIESVRYRVLREAWILGGQRGESGKTIGERRGRITHST